MKDLSVLWWERLSGIEDLNFMNKYNVKKYSKKVVNLMYDAEFKQKQINLN